MRYDRAAKVTLYWPILREFRRNKRFENGQLKGEGGKRVAKERGKRVGTAIYCISHNFIIPGGLETRFYVL